MGASGAVMGVIGATAAVMLRGWLHERAAVAGGRGLLMAGFVAMQAGIDAAVPQMRSTAHLSGAALGFLAVLLVGDRLSRDRLSRDLALGDQDSGARLRR